MYPSLQSPGNWFLPPTTSRSNPVHGLFHEGLPSPTPFTNGRPAIGKAIWPYPLRHLLLTNPDPWSLRLSRRLAPKEAHSANKASQLEKHTQSHVGQG